MTVLQNRLDITANSLQPRTADVVAVSEAITTEGDMETADEISASFDW